MSGLNLKDFENLAQMLDKNAAFTRPKGQATGFSLQEDDASGVAAAPTAPHPGSIVASTSASGPASAAPASVPLPATVVDQQLRLPLPSHSKAAQQQRAKDAQGAKPQGNEIWTQQELEDIYRASLKAGGSSAIAAAVRANAAGSPGGRPTAATAARPQPAPGAEEPPYTVLYQQKIRAEDVYLGVDFTRDESSAASDGVVVKVQMPKTTSASGLALHVEPFQLLLSSPEYFLSAPLPRKVTAGAADAKWDSASKTLTIQLTADNSEDGVKVL